VVTSETLSELGRLKALFLLLPDTPAVYPEWERLVTAHQVIGKHAHDASLVAVMTVVEDQVGVLEELALRGRKSSTRPCRIGPTRALSFKLMLGHLRC
jgi:hypothetical protein